MKRPSLAMVVSLYGLLVVAACGGHTAPHQTEGAHSDTTISYSLDPLTVEDILVTIGKAGLAVPNPRM